MKRIIASILVISFLSSFQLNAQDTEFLFIEVSQSTSHLFTGKSTWSRHRSITWTFPDSTNNKICQCKNVPYEYVDGANKKKSKQKIVESEKFVCEFEDCTFNEDFSLKGSYSREGIDFDKYHRKAINHFSQLGWKFEDLSQDSNGTKAQDANNGRSFRTSRSSTIIFSRKKNE